MICSLITRDLSLVNVLVVTLQRQDGVLVQLGLVTTPHPIIQMALMFK